MSQQRAVIIEDQTVFREMLVELVIQEGIDVVGHYSHAVPALEALPELNPDIVFVDLLLPDLHGLEVVRRIHDSLPALRVVVVTGQEQPAVVLEAFRLKAAGIVTKAASLHDLREAIRRVASGGSYYCPTTSGVLREYSDRALDDELTGREREIVRHVAMGKTTKEIASLLHISAKTVSNHRYRIAQKLGVSDAASWTRYAIGKGWVGDDG